MGEQVLMRKKVAGVALFLSMCGIAGAQNGTTDLLQEGQKLSAQGKIEEGFKLYEKANKAAGQKCSLCFYRMAAAKMNMGDEGGGKAIEAARTPQEEADGYAIKGEVFLGFAEEKDRKDMAEAEEAFRTALKVGGYPILHLRIGTCLAREGNIDEARKEFQTFLDINPEWKDGAVVRRWIENPLRARYPTAPTFEFTGLRGEKVSLAQLAGKVVVLDFWGTWCPPCRASVPELKDLVKKYSAEKLVLISVSSDKEQDKWEKFVADNKMEWIQYRDADSRIQSCLPRALVSDVHRH
jgi:thiol-disulfide isomerase/thioredoxin